MIYPSDHSLFMNLWLSLHTAVVFTLQHIIAMSQWPRSTPLCLSSFPLVSFKLLFKFIIISYLWVCDNNFQLAGKFNGWYTSERDVVENEVLDMSEYIRLDIGGHLRISTTVSLHQFQDIQHIYLRPINVYVHSCRLLLKLYLTFHKLENE